jgi:hypothetical protein
MGSSSTDARAHPHADARTSNTPMRVPSLGVTSLLRFVHLLLSRMRVANDFVGLTINIMEH